MSINMLWCDSWILLATIYASRDKPAALDGVIAAADYIQHAIVTFEEMEGALARLTEKGFLVNSEEALSPSETTIDYYRSVVTGPRRRALDEQADLAKFIVAPSWDRNYRPQSANEGASFPALTHQMFNNAVEKYVGRHRS